MRIPQARRDWTRRAARDLTFRALPLLAALAFAPAGFAASPELGWSYAAPGPLRVHVVRGYYYRDYRIEEALAHAGANLFTRSTQEDRGISQWGGTSSPDAGWLRDCRDPAGQAMNHHLVIVCSVGARSFGKNQQVLVDFVKHGGSVLFLCESYTFGDRSGKSLFAEMAPLEFPAEGPWNLETESAGDGLELKPGPDSTADQLPGATAESPPRAYSVCQVKPKPGAKVLLVAGDKPVLILGEFGRGRVAVFTATCRGYPKEGQVAYWRWDGWPALLAETLRGLAADPGNLPHGLDQNARRHVADAMHRAYDLLDGVDETGRQEFEALLGRAAVRCHDKPTADFLLGLVAEYPLDLPHELNGALGRTLSPWVDENSAEHARTLIESGEPGKTILGLVLLGAARSDDARSTLEQFHATGAPRKRTDSSVSLAAAEPESVAAVMRAEQDAVLIRRAAVTGLGQLGDPAALPALKEIVAADAAKGQYRPGSEPDAIEPEHRDYQNALMASLLSGDAEAAGPVVDCLLENLSVISRAPTEEGQRQSAVAWQEELYGRLGTAPGGVLPAVAKRIAAEQNSSITPVALAAFGGKKLSPEIATALGESSVAAVAIWGHP